MSAFIRRNSILLSLIALAVLARLIVWLELSGFPLLNHLISDAKSYFDWASLIANGDLLSRAKGTFYQAPLYPYALAGIHTLFGSSMVATRIVQIAWAGLATGAFYIACKRLFDGRTAWLASLLWSLWPACIVSDLTLQKESLGQALMAFWLLALAQTDGSKPRYFILGVVSALVALVREPCVLLLLPAMALPFRLDQRGAKTGVVLIVMGAGLIFMPIFLRNGLIGDSWSITTSQSGPNFYIGNNQSADGRYQPLRTGRSDTPFEAADARAIAETAQQRPLSKAQVSSYWWSRARDEIAHDPLKWVRLYLRKLTFSLHAYHFPDAYDLDLFISESLLLRTLSSFLNRGLLTPIFCLALFLGTRSAKHTLMLHAFIILWLATSLFFIFDRYLFPLVGLMLPFASVVPTHFPRCWAKARSSVGACVTAVLVLVLSGYLVNRPLGFHNAMASVNLGTAYRAQGDTTHAEALFKKALSENPNLLEANLNLGNLYLETGRPDQALPVLQAAFEINAGDPEVIVQLAQAYELNGMLKDAFALYGRLPPGSTTAKQGLAHTRVAARLGLFPEAQAILSGLRRRIGATPDIVKMAATLVALDPQASPQSMQGSVEELIQMMAAHDYRDLDPLRILAALTQRMNQPEVLRKQVVEALKHARASQDQERIEAIQDAFLKAP